MLVIDKTNEWERYSVQSAIAKTRINIKSLAAESKFIRQEIKKCRDESLKGCLNQHRIDNVRREARSAHLVLACLKGNDYLSVEIGAKNEPPWQRVKEKLSKHFMPAKIKDQCYGWIEKSKQQFQGQNASTTSTTGI